MELLKGMENIKSVWEGGVEMKHIILVLLLFVTVSCAGPTKHMMTPVYECMTDILRDRNHFFCNNKELASWERWKKQSPNAPIGQGAYEKDLFSGRIYNKGECPRTGWSRLFHWCLD